MPALPERRDAGRPTTDTPPSVAGLRRALDIADRVTAVLAEAAPLFAFVEERLGLRFGQLRVLEAVNDGHTSVRSIAEVIGEHPAAVEATLTTLVEAGLVEAVHEPTGNVRDAAITEAGRARFDQFTALGLLAAARLADERGPDGGAVAVAPPRTPEVATTGPVPVSAPRPAA